MEPPPPEGYYQGVNATVLLLRQLALALSLSSLALAQAPAQDANAVAGVVGAEQPTDQLWSDIKGDTYEQRVHFSQGTHKMLAKLDDQIAELKAKRAAMTTDTKDWDFNMKEVDESRVLLKGTMSDAAKATTPETWSDARDKVGEAWKRSQLAVDKMNTTRTT